MDADAPDGDAPDGDDSPGGEPGVPDGSGDGPPDRVRAAARATPLALSTGAGAVVGSVLAVGASPDVVVAPVSRVVTDATPAAVVAFAITRLGDAGEQLALLTAVVLAAALLGAAGVAGATAARRRGLHGVLAGGAATAAVAGAVTLSVPSAVGAGAGAAVALAVARLSDGGDLPPEGRRSVLRSAALALGAGALGVAYGRRRDRGGPRATDVPAAVSPDQGALLDAARERSLDVEGLEPLVSDSFYEVDINQLNPRPDPEEWTLSVTGAVGSPATYDYDDVTGRPAHHRFVTLRCVGEPLNGRKLDNALWTGVPVADLLDGVDPAGEFVMVRAADGYYEEFPAEALSDALVAYGMNGGPLPRAHGAPARLLVPGHWGEINVKWVTEIEFLERERDGYWEKRGWHGTGPVNTVAKHWVTNHLDDGRVEVAGHAYAGTRGVRRVEVSTDGGLTWTDARLSTPLPGGGIDAESDATATAGAGGDRSPVAARDAWRQWVHRYDPPPGDHEVVVRAVDGTGTLQPKEESAAFPSGATGWVRSTVSRG